MALLGGEDRGQATQVGAILIFGIIIVGMAGFQANVVPAENKQVEFNSYLSASADITNLKTDIIVGGQEGIERGRTVETGTTYPSRALFVNPGSATGRLQTTESRNLIIWNASAIESEETNVQEFWNGTRRNISTKKILFVPSYNELDASPLAVSSVGVTRRGRERTIGLSPQSLVNERRITFVAVRGDLNAGGISTPITVDPISAPMRRVTITNETGSDLVISLPFESNTTRNRWINSSIADRINDTTVVSDVEAGYIRSESLTVVNVTFNPGTYSLGLALVEVRGQNDQSNVASTNETYIIPTRGNGTAMNRNQKQRLSVEVRDEFDNPVSGVTVSFNTSQGSLDGNLKNKTITTNSDGRASVVFSPNQTGNLTVTASFSRATQFNETTFELSVSLSGGGGSGGGGGGDSTGPLVTSIQTNTTTVAQGELFNLTATIDDTGRGGTAIIDAEWFSNRSVPNGGAGTGFDMSAVDGEFDQPTEDVRNITINTSGWTTGSHNLSVRGQDGNNNWGPVTNTSLTVTSVASIIDSFEDNDLNEYSGDTNAFSITNSPTKDGQYVLEATPTGNALKSISSTSGLANYPRQGDTFRFNVNVSSYGANNQNAFKTGIGFGETSGGNHYQVTLVGQQDGPGELRLSNGSVTNSTSITINLDQWYEVTVEWGVTTIKVTLTDSTGTDVAKVSIDTNGDQSDYFAFRSQEGSTFFDYVRITS